MKCNIAPPSYDEINSFFTETGIISKNLTGFERRHGQAEMASAVYHSLLERSHALIEAPCGIGKSYAYLIPAAIYSKKYREKIVISTNTKNLQEQLKNNDLPTMILKYGLDFNYRVLKGKNNYICLRKLYDIKNNGIPLDLFSDYTMAERLKLKTDIYLDAAKEIEHKNLGEFEELSHEACGDFQFQKLLACTSVECINNRCAYFKECNYFGAINNAAKADIIVVNHSLYFSCLMIEASSASTLAETYGEDSSEERESQKASKDFQNPIPSHSKVIFDEAHHLPDITQNSFSISLSYPKLGSNLNMITNLLKKNLGKKSKKISERISEQKSLVEEKMKLYFNYIGCDLTRELLTKSLDDGPANSAAGEPNNSNLARQMLFNSNHVKKIIENPNSQPLIDAIKSMSELSLEIGEVLSEKKVGINASAINSILNEMAGLIDFWNNIGDFASENILWCSLPWRADSRDTVLNVELIASPVNVAEILKNNLFASKDAAILTSATLSTENNFKYIKSETGLDSFKPLEIIFDSPYDLKNQAAFIIPPLDVTPKDRKFNQSAAKWVQDIISESKGRTLVLFTSKYMMEFVYSEVSTTLGLNGYKIIMQGQKPRSELLKIFKQDLSSCLFALDSFWEGIDVKGEALSTLIITKLPFKVPTHPLNEAKDAYLKKLNRDPFYESSIPWTILKLKQGVGRLIRHKTDRGVVAILDTRLRDTFYGRKIAGALPQYRNLKDIKEIPAFLKEKDAGMRNVTK